MLDSSTTNPTDDPDVSADDETVHVTIGIDVPAAIRQRVEWVFETMLAPYAATWEFSGPRGTCHIGYGRAGDALTINHIAADWDTGAGEPEDDGIARAFWWLARVEEIDADPSCLDQHGRFQPTASTVDAPPGEAPVDVIAARIAEDVGLRLQRWPNDAPYALALSHDIDTPVRWTRIGRRRDMRAARDLWRSGRRGTALRYMRSIASWPWRSLRGNDPNNNLEDIMQIEARYGARSTFFLMCGAHEPFDGDMTAYDAVRGTLIEQIEDGNCEVGLHGSYTVSDMPARLADELDTLSGESGRTITSHRYHYLRHQPDRDHPWLERSGVAVDASMGYAARWGYRAGWSYPYRAWNHETGRATSLLIVPLALMDATLDDDRYGGMTPDSAESVIRPMLAHARAFGSGASVLWHNDRFAEPFGDGWGNVYADLLERAAADGAWLTTVGDMAAAWNARLAAQRAR